MITDALSRKVQTEDPLRMKYLLSSIRSLLIISVQQDATLAALQEILPVEWKEIKEG